MPVGCGIRAVTTPSRVEARPDAAALRHPLRGRMRRARPRARARSRASSSSPPTRRRGMLGRRPAPDPAAAAASVADLGRGQSRLAAYGRAIVLDPAARLAFDYFQPTTEVVAGLTRVPRRARRQPEPGRHGVAARRRPRVGRPAPLRQRHPGHPARDPEPLRLRRRTDGRAASGRHRRRLGSAAGVAVGDAPSS